jgi:hypothetical protein
LTVQLGFVARTLNVRVVQIILLGLLQVNHNVSRRLNMSTKIDKFKTALANGYTEGQAATIARWSTHDFMGFMNDVIRGDGARKVWVFADAF